MQYLLREHVPTSYALADAYTLCNRWFCSVLGPTYPNRYYWHSAQSNGIMDNTIPATIWTNLYDRLNAAGVDWTYYYGDVPVLSLLGSAGDGHIKRFKDFATDCAAGTLPPVVYIDPSFSLNDDHPPHHLSMGQQLIGAVYTALATSPQWKNILFCLTYDENGGFFDHVAPPTAADDLAAQGFDQLGFRVPTVVMGPYVKQGVSSVVYDHTSVLRHIENMFGLDEPDRARRRGDRPQRLHRHGAAVDQRLEAGGRRAAGDDGRVDPAARVPGLGLERGRPPVPPRHPRVGRRPPRGDRRLRRARQPAGLRRDHPRDAGPARRRHPLGPLGRAAKAASRQGWRPAGRRPLAPGRGSAILAVNESTLGGNPMKKLATALAAAAAFAVATPTVLACPGMHKDRTADKKADTTKTAKADTQKKDTKAPAKTAKADKTKTKTVAKE